jgi:anti-sigma-K factor RskA
MSDAPDYDLLAGEYVLGTLEGKEAAEAKRLLATDPAFAAAVRAWEERLTPLAAAVSPVAPAPELWDRIEAATTATVVPLALHRRLRVWQASTGVALAIAASLAAFIVLRAPPPSRVAVLAPTTGGVPVLVATMAPNGVLNVRPDGAIAVPSDRDLELWALGEGETRPRSLGVLPAAGAAACGDADARDAVAGESGAARRLADRAADRAGGLWREAGGAGVGQGRRPGNGAAPAVHQPGRSTWSTTWITPFD